MYEYRAVPFLATVKSHDRKAVAQAAEQLSTAINNEVLLGWEFCQVASVSVAVAPGCLAALGGAKATPMLLDQLIFRRPKQGA